MEIRKAIILESGAFFNEAASRTSFSTIDPSLASEIQVD